MNFDEGEVQKSQEFLAPTTLLNLDGFSVNYPQMFASDIIKINYSVHEFIDKINYLNFIIAYNQTIYKHHRKFK